MPDFNSQDLRYAKLVDRYSRYIKSPVLRLKFLNNTLNSGPQTVRRIKLPIVGTLPERAILIAELAKVLPPDEPAPLALRLTSLLYRIRYLVYAAFIASAIGLAAGLIYAVSRVMGSISTPTEARGIQASQPAENTPGADAVKVIGTEAGIGLDRVWLAEQGDGYEFYSNGARVLTQFETTGPKRVFYRFSIDAIAADSDEPELVTTPVGILYHLSESDLLPFADRYNASLQDRSRALLEYARKNELYNYIIDRFGRTYRIVRDEFTANHAGNSVWSDGSGLYVGLSPSFIGICLEGRSSGPSAIGQDGINEAQIYAARVLTAVLRSKYEIPDANCVTHGLVSVNPSNRLMGYHTDWVAGFPFEAVGLTNKYETELVAISRLGFTYDRAYVAAAGGKPWPGLERAESALRERSRREGRSIEEGRRAGWRAFQRAYRKQLALPAGQG
ncbi:MAG TPA: peptidoglycan recognition family protein [Blastocatellia bacterium]|nr:peptidoglycan recognition family protein [Blastocatellia bacterium]